MLARNRCQVCNSDLLLQVHHRKYPDTLGLEEQTDVTVLCRRCHDLFHNAAKREGR
jgi:5-methylcytosine-specific restriction endonuclease McrA